MDALAIRRGRLARDLAEHAVELGQGLEPRLERRLEKNIRRSMGVEDTNAISLSDGDD